MDYWDYNLGQPPEEDWKNCDFCGCNFRTETAIDPMKLLCNSHYQDYVNNEHWGE